MYHCVWLCWLCLIRNVYVSDFKLIRTANIYNEIGTFEVNKHHCRQNFRCTTCDIHCLPKLQWQYYIGNWYATKTLTLEIFTVNVQTFIWKSFESNHKRMTTFSQFNWRTFVDKAMVNFYCCLLFCPTVSWSPCICALGTLVVIMFWFVSIIVETIEITSESMEMAFSGLIWVLQG